MMQVGAVEAITRGEIDIAITTARKYPRQPAVVKSEMLSYATLDEETAAACFYSLPRGGKNIQGPSVRLAEIAVTAFGNLRVGCRVMATVTQGDHPHVIVQAVCMDMQKNVAVTIEKRRRIIGKKSAGGAISDDDINLAVNSCTAIAYRDCVFKIVPLSLIKPVYEQCKKVAVGDAKSLVDRRGKCLETFAKLGVSQERVLARLEKKKVEEITLDDIETLIGIHTTLKEGEETVESIFPIITGSATKTAGPTPPTPPAPVQPVKPADKPVTATTIPPVAEPTQPASVPQEQNAAPSTPQTAETPPAATQEAAQGTNEAVQTGPEPSQPGDSATSADAKQPGDAPATPTDPLGALRNAIGSLGIPEKQLMRYLQALKPPMARGTQNSLDQLADVKLMNILNQLESDKVLEAIRATAH